MREKHFNIERYLSTDGDGRTIIRNKARQTFFSQGGDADSLFYLQHGRAKLTVVSKRGKEATVTLLVPGDFFGEEAISGEGTERSSTASAVTSCIVLKITRAQMIHVLHVENAFSDFFMQYVLRRAIRTQADLVDQLFNSSERRLARALLLMADLGKPGEPEMMLPHVTQETLAEMIGTTRSRVSFFMNRFRKLGYVEYKGHIRVHKTLLNIVLRDQLPEENASRPKLLDPPRGVTRKAETAKAV